jgi:hypothetical protein
MLAFGPKACEFNSGQGKWIFKSDKKSAAHFPLDGEVKLLGPCHQILRHVKEPFDV